MKEQLTKILFSKDNVIFAYLFGSYVNDTFKQGSDVDIAVYLKDKSLDARLELHSFT